MPGKGKSEKGEKGKSEKGEKGKRGKVKKGKSEKGEKGKSEKGENGKSRADFLPFNLLPFTFKPLASGAVLHRDGNPESQIRNPKRLERALQKS